MIKQTGGFTTQRPKSVEEGRSQKHGYGPSESNSDLEPLFDNNEDRRKFIFKVYCILAISLGFCGALILFMNLYEPAVEFAMEYWYLSIVFSIIFLVFYLIFVCCPSVGRSSPINLIFYVIMVICLGFSTAIFAVFFEMKIIMYAFLLTMLMTAALTLIALIIPVDFTTMGGLCCVMLALQGILVISLTILASIIELPMAQVIIAGVTVVIICFIMIYDTQLIVGGKYGLAQDEYLTGAIILLVNILSLFRNLLILLAEWDD